MSKKAIIFHILAAVFLLCGFIIARMPAAIPLGKLQATPVGQFLQFSEASGTLRQGSVSGLVIRLNAARIVLGQVRWKLEPLSLLGGELSLHVRAEHDRQTLDGNVSLSISRTLKLQDMEIVAPAALVSQFYPIPGQVGGQVELSIAELAVNADGLQALDAQGVYRDAHYTLSQLVELGTYAGRFSMQDGTVRVDVSDLDAHVGMNGFATYVPKSREYDVDVKLSPRASANPMIAQGMGQVLPQGQDGSYQFRKRGQM